MSRIDDSNALSALPRRAALATAWPDSRPFLEAKKLPQTAFPKPISAQIGNFRE